MVACRAVGPVIEQQARFVIGFRRKTRGRPDSLATRGGALQVVDGAMAFVDRRFRKPGALELAIDIAGEYGKSLGFGLTPTPEQGKAGMRDGGAVQIQPMPVETPGTPDMAAKAVRVGNVLEIDTSRRQRRVSAPKSFTAPKVRLSRIHTHAGAGRDDQGVGLGNQFGGSLDDVAVWHQGGASTPLYGMASRLQVCSYLWAKKHAI